ncbi:MAG: HAMP domain-containing sensor histidine kinase [Prolixibacteraceae bacterium]|jgi:two-component system nitrogen regulation sensor histidine kinase NtrY|nr:HAMP domain-containing sensor histidine kinase [Prolixibacteraceae bacterium]
MRITKHIRLPFIFILIFLAAGILSEKTILNNVFTSDDMRSVNKTLHRKLEKIEHVIFDATKKLEDIQNCSSEEIFTILSTYNKLFERDELSLVVFKNDTIVYWSDNVNSFVDIIMGAEEGLLQLPNGWVTVSKKEINDFTVYGLVLLKHAYNINNHHLGNKFAKGFNLPDNYKIQFYKSKHSSAMYDLNKRYLFSIKPAGDIPCMYQNLYLPLILYMAALIALFIFIYRINRHFFHNYPLVKLLIIFGILCGIYLLSGLFNLPESVHLLSIFSPHHFAYSNYLSSIGDFLLLCVLIFFWGICFVRTSNRPKYIKKNPALRIIMLVLSLSFMAIYLIIARLLIKTLIMNSNISLAVYRIEEITIHSFAGFLIIGLLFFSAFFIIIRISQNFRRHTSLLEFSASLIFTFGAISLLLILIDKTGDYRINVFFALAALTGFYINKKNTITHRLSLIVVFTSIFTIAGLSLIVRFDEKKEQQVQELMALNMTSEHDPTAELFLRDIDNIIKTDTLLKQELYPPFEIATNYIEQDYFGGYFREYDIQFTICQSSDSVIIHPENIKKHCFIFFDSLLTTNGNRINSTNFYFLENMNGRKTYLGRYYFTFEDTRPPTSVFIELNSRLLSEGTGFPELLLPARSIEKRISNSYSFAKYNHKQLVDRGGEYTYALNLNTMSNNNYEETTFEKWDNYIHCIYPSNENNLIIVSRPVLNIFDYLTAFPYLFIFLFGLSVIVNFITNPKIQSVSISKSLRLRIQTAIVGIVFMALLLVGTGTVFYNINQYRVNHQNELLNTINTLSSEIGFIFNDIDKPDDDLIEFLEYELVRMSDIFWTDINIFDTSGSLLATSRPEVFRKGLISENMENSAYTSLITQKPIRLLHEEHIGSLKYISGYVPLRNNNDETIAYLNLPYFTKERAFRQQITTFILAFINLYVFLLLASVLAAYFISARITDPLKLIRENLSGMQLGKKTKPIQYKTDDEIGLLVSEYNKKLYELEESAELLARSERETAWREMAKQIAHEIKNPLTPMKLNIQFLLRTPSNTPDYTQKVEKVSQMLIEQIDNLSAIASAFSNFAKIPKAHGVKFNVAQRLSETIELYDFTGQISIRKHFSTQKKIYIEADKEQFSRAIINLIRNSIQSIPEDKSGIIDIYLSTQSGMVNITFEDNGKGIPDNLKDSIFVPNFTTKSSGAGLGLAITRNIIETFKGKIWFESTVGKGTKFFIELPAK